MISQLNRAIWKGALLTMLVTLLGFTIALAASGDLDPGFSGDGKQHSDFDGPYDVEIAAIARQGDGKIVAVGRRLNRANRSAATTDFALARYNPNGSLDATFSGDGMVLTNFGAVEEARDVAIQPWDQKIVVSGVKCPTVTSVMPCDLAMARYNPGGTLDVTFSLDGKQTVGFGSGDNGTWGGLAIQADRKIVVAGYMKNAEGHYDFAVYRLGEKGNPDITFRGDGKVNIGFGVGNQDDAEDLLLQGGKIVVGGETCWEQYPGCDFALARLNSNGTLDTTFSGDGKQTTDLWDGNDYIFGLAAAADGKIVAVGTQKLGAMQYAAVARYNSDGTPDSSFGGLGKLTVSGLGNHAWMNGVIVQADGKIVAAGVGGENPAPDFAIIRLFPNGGLDASFSGDSRLTIDFFGHSDVGRSLIRLPDGKYVIGGFADDGAQRNFALARVLP